MLRPKPGRMTAGEFLEWAKAQESGRYELFDGEIVAMAPERVGHNEDKFRIALRLSEAIDRAGLSCQMFTDGMAVAIDETTSFEPDAMVRCGDKLDRNVTVVNDPVIVVEVLSPSTGSIDTNLKLGQYFRLPSVQHYLIVRPTSPGVLHYRRTADGVAVQIVGPGELRLDPPGIALMLD